MTPRTAARLHDGANRSASTALGLMTIRSRPTPNRTTSRATSSDTHATTSLARSCGRSTYRSTRRPHPGRATPQRRASHTNGASTNDTSGQWWRRAIAAPGDWNRSWCCHTNASFAVAPLGWLRDHGERRTRPARTTSLAAVRSTIGIARMLRRATRRAAAARVGEPEHFVGGDDPVEGHHPGTAEAALGRLAPARGEGPEPGGRTALGPAPRHHDDGAVVHRSIMLGGHGLWWFRHSTGLHSAGRRLLPHRRRAPRQSSMDLLAYFRVLRRHWRLIVAVTVAGAALGAASTLLDRSSTTKRDLLPRDAHARVRRQHQLGRNVGAPLREPGGDRHPRHHGRRPRRASPKRSEPRNRPGSSATRVSTVVNPDSDTLEVTAIDPNPQRADVAGRHVRRRAHRQSHHEGARRVHEVRRLGAATA